MMKSPCEMREGTSLHRVQFSFLLSTVYFLPSQQTPAGTESQDPNTSIVRLSEPRTSHNTAVLPSSRVCNRPHGDRWELVLCDRIM